MKLIKKLRFSAIMSVLVLTISCGFSVRAERVDPTASREWRAYGGYTLKAALVKLDGDEVVLKAADGSVRNVPLRMLIAEDQTLAKELAAQLAAADLPAAMSGSGNRLSEFTEGPGKGYFAFYENKNFILSISPEAKIRIQCLDAGKPIGKPIDVDMGHSFISPETHRPEPRRILSFSEAYQPVLQPDTVTLEGLLVDDIPFGFSLAFEGQSIHLSGWVEDSTAPRDSKDYIPAFKFASTHSFAADVMVEDQKKALEVFWLDVNPLKGRAFKQFYGERPLEMNTALRSVSFHGDIFGSRHLSVSPGPSRASELRLTSRNTTPIFSGFELGLVKRKPELRDPMCRITLTIN